MDWARVLFYFWLLADVRQHGKFPVRKIYICCMNWTLIDILKCIKHIKLAVSDIFDGYLRCLLHIIINMQGFIDISCQISVFPVDNVRVSTEKITI